MIIRGFIYFNEHIHYEIFDDIILKLQKGDKYFIKKDERLFKIKSKIIADLRPEKEEIWFVYETDQLVEEHFYDYLQMLENDSWDD